MQQKTLRSAQVGIVECDVLAHNTYRVTIAANEKVRQPPDMDFKGLSVERYSRNPVVMWAHDVSGNSPAGGLPVGRTLRLEKTPEGKLVAEFEFLEEDPFAQRVKNAWDRGFLRAASISWLPIESEPAGNGRWRDTKAELLEWSIVAVPADPDALSETHIRMIHNFLGGDGMCMNTANAGGLQPGLPDAEMEAALVELQSVLAVLQPVAPAEGCRDIAPDSARTGADDDGLDDMARELRRTFDKLGF